MKGMKVTEAFELPLVIEFVENDEFTLRHESKRQFHAAFKNKDQAYVAANCINHADALADALESMLEHEKEMTYSLWNYSEDYSEDRACTFEESEEFARFKDSFADELAALEAYRGVK